MNNYSEKIVIEETSEIRKQSRKEKKNKNKKPRIPLRKYTLGGRISTAMAITEVFAMCAEIVWSFHKRGNAGAEVGIISALVLLFSVAGFIMGIYSFKDEIRFLKYSWIGTISNMCVFLIIMMMLLVFI